MSENDSGKYTIDKLNPVGFAFKDPEEKRGYGFSAQEYTFIKPPESSEWQCYLFGNRPGSNGMIYTPSKGRVPNWFVRWAMRIFFDCLWVKDKSEKKL